MRIAPLLCLMFLISANLCGAPDAPYHTVLEKPFDASKASAEQQRRMHHYRELMNSAVFRNISLKNATLRETVQWLHKNLKIEDKGVSFILREGPEPVATRVILSAKEMTAPQVLDSVCTQVNYDWCFAPYAIVLSPSK